MRLEWETGETWVDRTFSVESGNEHIASLNDDPTLDELRKISRNYGLPTERLNLWQAGLICSECNSEINERFAADPAGNILCWDCAMETPSDDEHGVTTNTDPTKSVMSESYLHTKGLCDHVINVATGCRHGCEFCYVPTTPAIESRGGMLNEQAGVGDPQSDWGSYLLYRDDLPERLRIAFADQDPSQRKQTDRGRGIVMLSSGTDCYQDRRTSQITRGVVTELIKEEIPVRILTRSPAVVRDLDLFEAAGDLITVGSSIPSFNEELVRAIEPDAPPPMKRWEALDTLQKHGVSVYVSMSPTYPLMDENEIEELLGHFRALGDVVVFHEPINPRGENFQQCYTAAKEAVFEEVANELERMQDDHQYWVEYALRQIDTVQRVATRFDGDVKVHSWPDQELIEATSGQLQTKLQTMREAVPPEEIGGGEIISSSAQSALELER